MLFNGKYYNKPGHLGMTRAELLEALQGGGGGIETVTVELTADEALSIYQGNNVIKSIEISGTPGIMAITTPDGNSLLCYLSVITATTLTWRNVADAELNIACQYNITDKELDIAQRNLS